MPTANEEIRDALIRHQVGMIRASGTARNRIIAQLNRAEDDLRGKIDRRLARINERGIDLGPGTTRRLIEIEEMLRDVLGKTHREIGAEFTAFMLDAAQREPLFFRRMLDDKLDVLVDFRMPATGILRSIVRAQPFQGKVLRDWLNQFEAGDRRRMMEQIRIGMVQGESVPNISRRIFGTQRLEGRDGVRQITRRGADLLARTATNAILNKARTAFAVENADVIKVEVYTATLDARTTIQCASLDGNRYPVGRGPIPPLHPACRSTRVPSIDGGLIGRRPAKPGTERELLEEYAGQNKLRAPKTRDGLPRGHKGRFDEFSRSRVRALTGQVPASQTYAKFLRNQTVPFQDEVLGPTRARLFREGKITMDKFVDRSGRPYSLDDLMRREPEAFVN